MNIAKGIEVLKELKREGFKIPYKLLSLPLDEANSFNYPRYYYDVREKSGISVYVGFLDQEWDSGSMYKELYPILKWFSSGDLKRPLQLISSRHWISPTDIQKEIDEHIKIIKSAGKRFFGINEDKKEIVVVTYASWNDEMIEYTIIGGIDLESENKKVKAQVGNLNGWNFEGKDNIPEEYKKDFIEALEIGKEVAANNGKDKNTLILEAKITNEEYYFQDLIFHDAYIAPQPIEYFDNLTHFEIVSALHDKIAGFRYVDGELKRVKILR